MGGAAVTTAAAGAPDDERTRELAGALDRLRGRIATACVAAGRSPGEVTLVAVTKTHPADDVRRLAALGVTDIGENRLAELEAKRPAAPALRWHYLGRMQSRHTKDIAEQADVVHSVDRAEIALRLGRRAVAAARQIEALVQLSFDGDPGRGGVVAAALPTLADAVAGTPGLRLAGLMGVPPIGADPVAAYSKLAALATDIRRSHPGATWLSAGMSGDLEAAVAAGATHLRIGTALLGRRAGMVG